MATTQRERTLTGRRLRDLRVETGMSARLLALRAGLTASSIWNMENGTSPVSKSAMAKISKPLGLTYEELEVRLYGGIVRPPEIRKRLITR